METYFIKLFATIKASRYTNKKEQTGKIESFWCASNNVCNSYANSCTMVKVQYKNGFSYIQYPKIKVKKSLTEHEVASYELHKNC